MSHESGVRSQSLGRFMAVLSMLAFVAPALTAQVDRIQTPIDGRNTVTLSGETRQEARPENDRGVVDPNTPLEYLKLLLQPSGDKQADCANSFRA